jgi:hypothetical protein
MAHHYTCFCFWMHAGLIISKAGGWLEERQAHPEIVTPPPTWPQLGPIPRGVRAEYARSPCSRFRAEPLVCAECPREFPPFSPSWYQVGPMVNLGCKRQMSPTWHPFAAGWLSPCPLSRLQTVATPCLLSSWIPPAQQRPVECAS